MFFFLYFVLYNLNLNKILILFIYSPSLFRLPSTPQLSSTQFEWTIDEVSSLNPANVEAHETQFISTIDPEIEAKAQAAINSYFKETLEGIFLPKTKNIFISNYFNPSFFFFF